MNIIQHHEAVDFEAYFTEPRESVIALGAEDYELLLHGAEEVHTFVAEGDGEERIKQAVETLITNIGELPHKPSRVLLEVQAGTTSDLKVNEFSNITKLADSLGDCDLVFGITKSEKLGTRARLYLLAAIDPADKQ